MERALHRWVVQQTLPAFGMAKWNILLKLNAKLWRIFFYMLACCALVRKKHWNLRQYMRVLECRDQTTSWKLSNNSNQFYYWLICSFFFFSLFNASSVFVLMFLVWVGWFFWSVAWCDGGGSTARLEYIKAMSRSISMSVHLPHSNSENYKPILSSQWICFV